MSKSVTISTATRNQALIALMVFRADVEKWAQVGEVQHEYFAAELVKINAAISELEASFDA